MTGDQARDAASMAVALSGKMDRLDIESLELVQAAAESEALARSPEGRGAALFHAESERAARRESDGAGEICAGLRMIAAAVDALAVRRGAEVVRQTRARRSRRRPGFRLRVWVGGLPMADRFTARYAGGGYSLEMRGAGAIAGGTPEEVIRQLAEEAARAPR